MTEAEAKVIETGRAWVRAENEFAEYVAIAGMTKWDQTPYSTLRIAERETRAAHLAALRALEEKTDG